MKLKTQCEALTCVSTNSRGITNKTGDRCAEVGHFMADGHLMCWTHYRTYMKPETRPGYPLQFVK